MTCSMMSIQLFLCHPGFHFVEYSWWLGLYTDWDDGAQAHCRAVSHRRCLTRMGLTHPVGRATVTISRYFTTCDKRDGQAFADRL